MAEKIKIAEFDIDVEQLTAAAAETAKALQIIKNEQKDLAKEGKNTDQAFIRNSVNLRGLQKDYNAQLKVLDSYMNATGKAIPIQQQIDAALRREANTVEELRKQNLEFIKIRNQVNIETKEGQEQIALLNSQIDANTEAIKENVSGMEQQKMGIGGYTDAIKDALGDTGLFNGALGNLQASLDKLGPIFNGIKGELSGVVEGFKTATVGTEAMSTAEKASAVTTNLLSASLKLLRVALIATGVGAIVVLLGSLVAYLSSSEKAGNRFSKVLKTVGGVVRELIRYLEPLGEILMDGIAIAFETIGKVATATFKIISAGLKALGFENAAQSVNEFSANMQKGAQMAEMLADKEEKFAESNRRANQTMLEYQREAEKLRQIRDNENLTIAERTAANEKLGETLKEQLATEKGIAIQALEIANIRIAADGRTTEALDEQAAAMERISDIQERVSGQESEQLTNRVALQKDAAAQAKTAADEAKARAQERVDQMNQEIELFKAQQGIRALSVEDEIALLQTVSDKRKAVLDNELKNKLISQTEYNTQVLELDNDLARMQAEAAVTNLERELSLNENRIEVERALSKAIGQAKLEEERNYEEQLKAQRAEFETARFEQGLITEQEYRDNILAIDQQYLLRQNELNLENEELVKQRKEEQRELDLETQLQAAKDLNKSQYELESLQLEQQRQRDLEAARLQYTDKAMLAQAEININDQANKAQVELAKAKDEAILSSSVDLMGSLAQILGEESKLGKAFAIGQATINTYLGATKALATLPPPQSFIAAAATIVSGLSTVAKISGIGTNIKSPKAPTSSGRSGGGEMQTVTIDQAAPFARGGKVLGGYKIKRSNGDNILATLKTGEVVLNENQQHALGGASTFRAIGVPGFATGGLVTGSNTTVQNSILNGFDNDMAESIGNAVREGAAQGTESGARQGITEVSTDNYLRNLSSN